MKEKVERILVATSLARASDSVLLAGHALARATGAELVIFHAFPLPPSYVVAPLGVAAVDPEGLEREREKRALRVVEQALRIDGGWPEPDVVVEVGAPHRMLLETAASRDADLLVVGGSEAQGPWAPLLGSTADRVLRKATCPVLVVRGDLARPPRRVLAPVDLSPVAEAALARGLGQLDAWSAAGGPAALVEVLFVLDPADREGLQFTAEQIDGLAERELGALIDRLSGASRSRLEPTIRVGLPRHEILEHLDEQPVDLVILATHGRGGFDRLLLGSIAASVAHRAPASVLFLPPRPSE